MTSSSRSKVLAVWLRPLVDYLEASGHDSRALFARTGVDVDKVFVPGARLDLADAAPLWRYAAELTGKQFIGLEIASLAPPLQADSMAIAMMASRNFYEATQRMCRLSHAICDGVDIELVRDEDELQVNFIIRPAGRQHLCAEAMDPAFLLLLGLVDKGLIARSAFRALKFSQPHPGAEAVRQLKRLVAIPCLFDCGHHGLVVDWHAAQQQNPYWNPVLAQSCEDLAQRELEQIDSSNVVNRVSTLLLERLADGTPQQEQIAELLGMGVRQLQRRLQQQGTSFGVLLQQLRLELAHRYLRDARMSLVDISLSLGFQDQSNFSKAFKQWQGESPGEYRKRFSK